MHLLNCLRNALKIFCDKFGEKDEMLKKKIIIVNLVVDVNSALTTPWSYFFKQVLINSSETSNLVI